MNRGAGGSPGGAGSFFIGLAMAATGAYLLLNSIIVHTGFGFGLVLWNVGSYGLTGGVMLVPLMVGIGMIFYSAKSPWGWILAASALAAIVIGVFMNIQIGMRSMSLLEMILIFILLAGGLGLFAKSLASASS